MHREEGEQLVACADCGASIAPEADRGYTFGTLGVVCWACATRRGGRYDAAQERWSEAPDVADLLARDRDLR